MNRSTPLSGSKRGRAWRNGPGVLLLLLGLAAAVCATPTASRVLAAMRGEALSGLRIQNLDLQQSAENETIHYPRDGSGPVRIDLPAIPPGGVGGLYAPDGTSLKDGVYAAFTNAERAFGLLLRSDWPDTGGAAYYEGAWAGEAIAVPLLKAFALGAAAPGTAALHDSVVDVQNADPAMPVDARFELRDPSGRLVTRWERRIGPGTSIGIDAASEPALVGLPSGFAGSLQVSADSPLALSASIDLTTWDRAVAAFQARPTQRAARALHAPLVASGALSSWILVLNPGALPAELELSYQGNADASGAACGSGAIRHGERSWPVPAGGMALFAQGAGGGSGLPEGCVASARLVADQALTAFVLLEDAGTRSAGAYLAPSAAEADRVVHLPFFRNRHTKDQMSTAIQVQNPADRAVELSLSLWHHDGSELPCSSCQVRLPAGAAWLWYPPAMAGVEDRANVWGWGRIEASGPVSAVVSDAAASGEWDTAVYRGLTAAEAGAGPGGPAARYLPFYSKRAVTRPPTPQPGPLPYRIYLPYLAAAVSVRVVGP